MKLKIMNPIQEPKEAGACECISCQAADFTTIGGLKSVEVIHGKLINWIIPERNELIPFSKLFLKNSHYPDTMVLVLTVEFENGSKEIYITDTVFYEINDNGKTVDTYYP